MAKFRVLTNLLVSAVFCLSASNAVGQHIQRGVIKALAPPYDDILLQARLEGTVRFEVRVGPSGEVEHAQATKPLFTPKWTELFEQYAREWRFEPNETSTTEEIVFRFRLVPRDSPPKDQGTAFISPATVEVRHLEPPPDVSRGPWKKNGALDSVIRVSDQAATSACSRTSLRRW